MVLLGWKGCKKEDWGDAMPRKPKQPCAYPGCPRLSERRYCEEHRKKVASVYDRYTRDPVIRRKYNGQWQRIRKRYVSVHPFCERCLAQGKLTPVAEVHHILPLTRGGTHEEVNLMSLCRSCHMILHSQLGDRNGKSH
ncbi:HNH endonuclease signature motif containing protein [uncultured Megasphaera sp.]|uniref:HNH endonuclease domain protein n=2 Tax=Megasphaera hutchinsoni TaxID=1588748 RepID=A0A134CH79_9FIRM|nr:HNH endonuclease signature motif containing protein [uncultured Megasphaera sp.]KXB91586.1 HNH endonuclease domain protein [Megasphaera hutchinsoni]